MSKEANKAAWEKLLTSERSGKGNSSPDEGFRTAFEEDADRIVFCSAFQRMQGKAQVFPLPINDFVRTRLTHSVETSAVGRSLGFKIGTELDKRYGLGKESTAHNVANIVRAASLLHDIGNPPFGHSGEAAISHWFQGKGSTYLKSLGKNQKNDLKNFEGNAQGFRNALKISGFDNEYGLQLTYPVLGAFLKYPCISAHTDKESIHTKKFNAFELEKNDLKKIANTLGLKKKYAQHAHCFYRHPLAYLVEAADDICYKIVDFQDAYKLNKIDFKFIEGNLKKLIKRTNSKIYKEKVNNNLYSNLVGEDIKISYLCALSIHVLVLEAAKTFWKNEEKLLKGEFNDDLLSQSKSKEILQTIKKATTEKYFNSRDILEIKAAGFNVIEGLLDTFVEPVLKYRKLGFNGVNQHSQDLLILMGINKN